MRALLIFLFCVSVLGWAWGDSLASKSSEASKLYKEGKVSEALSKWRGAQIEDPDNSKLHYNIGNGLHGQKKYEEAFNEYEKSLDSKDSELRQKAYYNIGNTHYRMGKLPEAIEDYKKSLEINPGDEDAKYNIEFIKKKLKETPKKEEQEQKESQQEQDKNKEQQKQSQSSQGQGQQQKEPEPPGSEKQEKDREKQEKENQALQEKEQQKWQEENKEDQAGESGEKPGDRNAEEKPPVQENKGGMSKEDALRLLDALRDDEKDVQKELRNQPSEGRYKADKDW